MNIELASPFAAVLSVSVALFTGVSATVGTLRPPTVTGYVEQSAPIEARAGDVVQIPWVFHKRGECIGENSRTWTGADGFHLTEAAKRNSLPESEHPIRPVIPTRVPDYAPPGRLELRIIGECERGGRFERFALGPVIFNVTE